VSTKKTLAAHRELEAMAAREPRPSPRPDTTGQVGEVVIGATRCYGDDDWFREITVDGVTFLAPLDEQDKARHILARAAALRLKDSQT
jgi:hypothetical protein